MTFGALVTLVVSLSKEASVVVITSVYPVLSVVGEVSILVDLSVTLGWLSVVVAFIDFGICNFLIFKYEILRIYKIKRFSYITNESDSWGVMSQHIIDTVA